MIRARGARRRSASVAVVAAVAVGLGALGFDAPGVGAVGPASDPEVVAAAERLDRAEAAVLEAQGRVDVAEAALPELRRLARERAGVLAELDGRIAALGADVDEAFDQHEAARRSYVDAAVAAYVSGMPDAAQLKAMAISDVDDRTQSLALAESVGDAFARRADRYRRTGEALDGQLRTLARERVGVRAASDDAASDLARVEAELESATSALTASTDERDAADRALVAATEAAAERFRLGGIDAAELARAADRSIAVFDINVRAYDAYSTAARTVDAQQPSCRVSWWALAAIGRIESGHGTFGGAVIMPNGDVAPRIVGPALTGGPFAVIRDTDGGRWDGDPVWDRAVGPMQFIPSTWRAWATDGNGDGVADPHNFYDAATAAARYLCRGARGRPLDTEEGLRAAAFSYNRSQAYVDEVIATARRYGGLTRPD